MKRYFQLFCSLLLLVVISYTTAHKSWIRLSYEINKLEIIEKFCVNKEETSFHCDGKCHLKTQLEKADAPTPKKANLTKENSLTLFHISFKKLSMADFFTIAKHLTPFEKIYQYLPLSSIFHPPK